MITTKPIDIEDAHADILQNAFKKHLPEGVHVYAFGSRANWQAKRASDLDLAVDANDALKKNIGNLEEELSLSALPYKVDIVNLNSISDSFSKAIMNDLVPILWDWRETKLGEVITLQRGYDLAKSKMLDGIIPVAGSNGIIGHHNTATTKAIGITIGRSGNLGNAYLYKTDFWAHNTTLYVKNFKNNDEIFIYYILKNIDFKSFNVGSAVPTLNRNHIHPLAISLPPLPEQKAIAAVLSSLDDKIDLLHRQNKTLESIAEVIFRKWFIEDADDSWEEVNLSQIADIICGKTPSKKRLEYFCGNVPFIKIPDMRNNTYIAQTTDSLTKSGQKSQSNKTIPPFSICVSCIATVGLVSMNVIESQTNQQINTVVPHKEIYRYYLFCYLRNSFDMLQAMGSGGTATLNINTDSFSKMNINKPNDITLKSFSNKVSTVFNKILLNQKQIKTLESLRNTLLPKLMSGSIRVKYEA